MLHLPSLYVLCTKHSFMLLPSPRSADLLCSAQKPGIS
jgi:hypothetical protein